MLLFRSYLDKMDVNIGIPREIIEEEELFAFEF